MPWDAESVARVEADFGILGHARLIHELCLAGGAGRGQDGKPGLCGKVSTQRNPLSLVCEKVDAW